MKRAILLFFLFALPLVLALSPEVYLTQPHVELIDYLKESHKNQTVMEVEHYFLAQDKYSIEVKMYQIVSQRITPIDAETLNPEQTFNRDYVPDGLIVNLYYDDDTFFGSCATKDSKCNLSIDLNDIPEDEFERGCVKLTTKFDGDEVLKLKESVGSVGLLCKDKNTMVGKAIDKTMVEVFNSAENQTICISFFIFIGFLLSSLYAAGINPLKYFDITSPRLPSAKSKIKFDPNMGKNDVLKGRKALQALSKSLARNKDALFKSLEMAAKVYFTHTVNKNNPNMSNSSKEMKVKREIKEFMSKITSEFEKLIVTGEKEIASSLKNVSGSDAIKKELEMRINLNRNAEIFLFKKLDEVGYDSKEDPNKIKKSIERYADQQKNYILTEMVVNYRSMLMRGAHKGKAVGKIRKFVESIPIVSNISIGASALINKGISPEVKILKYGYTKVKDITKSKIAQGKVDKLSEQWENPNFYNSISQGNLTEIEKIKLDAAKKEHSKINATLSEEDIAKKHKSDLILTTIKSEISDSDEKLKNVREELKKQIEEFETLLPPEKVKDFKKLTEKYLPEKLTFKELSKHYLEFQNKLDVYEMSDVQKQDIFEANKKKIKDTYEKYVEESLYNEKLNEDKQLLDLTKVSGVAMTPDTMLNNVQAKIAVQNLINESQNVSNVFLKNKIIEMLKDDKKKLEEFDKFYGELVLKYNPAERFDKICAYAESNEVVSDADLKKAVQIKDEAYKLNVSENPNWYLNGTDETLNFTKNLIEKYDLIELGIIDTTLNTKALISRYLEVYGGYDSKIGDEKLSSILKDKGFNACVNKIENYLGSETKDFESVIKDFYGTDTPHAFRLDKRTEKNIREYLPYFVFEEQFEENMKKSGFTNQLNDEKFVKLKEFYANSMSEIYAQGSYSKPSKLSDVFSEADLSKLTESEINFKERATEIFSILSNSLNLPENKKFIESQQKLIDSFELDYNRLSRDAGLVDGKVGVGLQSKFTNKWIKDSALHRVQAICVPTGMRENIFKLKDYVEDNVNSYNVLVDMVSELNNEKREQILLMNSGLGKIVEETSSLNGQQIYSHMSDEVMKVLGTSLDLYFRGIFETPRMDIIRNRFIEITFNNYLANKSPTAKKDTKSAEDKKKDDEEKNRITNIYSKVHPQILYDLLEDKFDKIRTNLNLNKKDLGDYELKELKKSILRLPNGNMYNRIYKRGWESFEQECVDKLKSYYPNLNVYDLYNLFDQKYDAIITKLNVKKDGANTTKLDVNELKEIRKELISLDKSLSLIDRANLDIIDSKVNTYDLMRSKGVEFLVGANDPTNLQEVYYVQKSYDKFSSVKDKDKILSLITAELEKKGVKANKSIAENYLGFFNNSSHYGLQIPGLELTTEGESRFGWYIDVRSNYIPLYQAGNKKRAYEIIVSTFGDLINDSPPAFDNTKDRIVYLNTLKDELKKEFDGLSINQIISKTGIKSEVLAKEISNYSDYFARYNNTNDYVPAYNTLGITGRALNVKMPQMVRQDDGSVRAVIMPTNEQSKFRDFTYSLQNEVNKHFVEFSMIGFMSESVSTFNTVFRSKDYLADSLSDFKSFDTSNVSNVLRNESIAKLIADLYEQKWSLTNGCDNNSQMDFKINEFNKTIYSELQKLVEKNKNEIVKYFNLDKNVDLLDAVTAKREELSGILNNADTDDKTSFIALKQLEFLNAKYDEHVQTVQNVLSLTGHKSLKEFEDIYRSNEKIYKKFKEDESKKSKEDKSYKSKEKIEDPDYKIIPDLELISKGLGEFNSKDVALGFDNLIDRLTPYAGEFTVKEKVAELLAKKDYYVKHEFEKIENYNKELNIYSKVESKLISDLKKKLGSKFSFNKNDDSLITYLGSLSKSNLSDDEKDFVANKIVQLTEIEEIRKKLFEVIGKSQKKIVFYDNLKKNKDDWAKINKNFDNASSKLSKEDIKIDRLFTNTSVLFEHFINSYEGLYKTRNLSSHTRRQAYGLTSNEYGGTQFAGPINSTPLQFYNPIGATGAEGWFSTTVSSLVFKKINKTFKERFALNYPQNDVPLISYPMGVSGSTFSDFFKIKFEMYKNRFGEYLNPTPESAPPKTLESGLGVFTELMSKNVRGERKITELLDFMGGSYRGTPRGARDILNYRLFRPNEIAMDFKDKIYEFKEARSIKKASEFLYDIGIYNPFTNAQFIAGREITMFNDIYYNNTTVSTFYPNRAMNLLSSAPHYSNPKYRNMAYNGMYKFSQSQVDLVNESVRYTDIGRTPVWNTLGLPFIPLALMGGPISFGLSLFSFLYVSGVFDKTRMNKASTFKGMYSKFFDYEDYYLKKYDFYHNKGLYSSMYNSSDKTM